jgi:uncharacterized protein DUF1203
MELAVRGIPSERAREFRAGGLDANGQPPLRKVAEGQANPCRHCLQLIAEGDEKLVLSYRPWFTCLTPAIVRGYGYDDWIRYETGDVVAGGNLAATCHKILSNSDVAYVHIRSKFNCFQCRVDRA